MLCWFLPYKMWISHKYTYVPSLMNPPPTFPRISAPSHHGRLQRAPFATQQIPTCYLFYIWWGMYVSATLSVPVPPFKMLIYFPVLKVIWTHPPTLIIYDVFSLNCFFFWFFSCYIFLFCWKLSVPWLCLIFICEHFLMLFKTVHIFMIIVWWLHNVSSKNYWYVYVN